MRGNNDSHMKINKKPKHTMNNNMQIHITTENTYERGKHDCHKVFARRSCLRHSPDLPNNGLSEIGKANWSESAPRRA